MLVLLATLGVLVGGLALGWRVSRNRRRTLLMTEVVLLGIIINNHVCVRVPSLFVLGAAGSSVFIWGGGLGLATGDAGPLKPLLGT